MKKIYAPGSTTTSAMVCVKCLSPPPPTPKKKFQWRRRKQQQKPLTKRTTKLTTKSPKQTCISYFTVKCKTVITTVKCQSVALSTHFTCFHGNLHVYLESALQLSELIMKVHLLGTVVHVNYSQIADLIASREHSVQAIVSVIFLQNKQKFKGSSQLCFS